MGPRPMSLFVKHADGSIGEPHEVYTLDAAGEAVADGFLDDEVSPGCTILLLDCDGGQLRWDGDAGWVV